MTTRVLLWGSTGLVGRNIQEHRSYSDYLFFCPKRSEVDLLNMDQTMSYVRRIEPDIIIHTAGLVGGIVANINNPIPFFFDNAQMGLNVIKSSVDSHIPRLINLASSCMYRNDSELPLGEDQLFEGPLEPTNEGYALSKILSTKFCKFVNQEQLSINYKTLIPCNLYGRFDKFEPERSHLVPGIIEKIHKAKKEGLSEVTIWGSGSAKREFMYASDLADAIYYCVKNYDNTPSIINIGTGDDHTILEYYQSVASVLDWNGTFVFDKSKPEGMRRKLLDISLQKKWGWKPETHLKAGIASSYQYFLETQNAL